MEKFYNFITNPEWWSVVATFVAATVAAVITYKLGKRQSKLQEQQVILQEQQNSIQEYQNKLQEQQIRLQEYELYKRMYIQIAKIDTFAKIFFHKIVIIFSDMIEVSERKNKINDIFQEANTLNDSFTECTFDIEFKQCGDAIDVGCYYGVLYAIKQATDLLVYMVENNKMGITNQQIKYKTDDITLINIILNCCKDKNCQERLRTELLNCNNVINSIKTSRIKSIIKERITPNNAK